MYIAHKIKFDNDSGCMSEKLMSDILDAIVGNSSGMWVMINS